MFAETYFSFLSLSLSLLCFSKCVPISRSSCQLLLSSMPNKRRRVQLERKKEGKEVFVIVVVLDRDAVACSSGVTLYVLWFAIMNRDSINACIWFTTACTARKMSGKQQTRKKSFMSFSSMSLFSFLFRTLKKVLPYCRWREKK